jgi:hypothetical protein
VRGLASLVLLLTLTGGPLSPAQVCLDRTDRWGHQGCGQGENHGQFDAAQHQSSVSYQSHSSSPAQGKCATGGLCLTGSVIRGETQSSLWRAMPARVVPLLGQVALKSVHDSPPVPPPIL